MEFSNVRVEFFPPNSTSRLQRLDQGVIRVVKHYYRKKLIMQYINHIDEGTPKPNLTVLDALHNLKAAWHNVTQSTIQNCFQKAGMFP